MAGQRLSALRREASLRSWPCRPCVPRRGGHDHRSDGKRRGRSSRSGPPSTRPRQAAGRDVPGFTHSPANGSHSLHDDIHCGDRGSGRELGAEGPGCPGSVAVEPEDGVGEAVRASLSVDMSTTCGPTTSPSAAAVTLHPIRFSTMEVVDMAKLRSSWHALNVPSLDPHCQGIMSAAQVPCANCVSVAVPSTPTSSRAEKPQP